MLLLVYYLLTGEFVALVLAGALLIYFLLQRPSLDRINQALKLDTEEQRKLAAP